MSEQEVMLAADTGRAVAMQQPWQEDRALALPSHVNAGTVLIEQERAIAEVKAKLTVARMNRRSTSFAHAEILRACGSIGFAEVAFYKYPRGGETISGPSIRMAEEIARCWGNFEYGLRELSQTGDASEMEAFAWDLETNMISSHRFTVQHIRDTKKGAKQLTEQRDIYELTANMGGRRLRARILAVMPKWLVEEATTAARATLLNGASTSPEDSRRKVLAAFVKIGITPEQIAGRIGHAIEALTPEEIVDLRGIFTSIKEGQTSAAEWFDLGSTADPAAAIAAAAKAAPAPQQKKAETKPVAAQQTSVKTAETKTDTPPAQAETATQKPAAAAPVQEEGAGEPKPEATESAPKSEITQAEDAPSKKDLF